MPEHDDASADLPPEIAEQVNKLQAATEVDPALRSVGVATEAARLHMLSAQHSSRVLMKAARHMSDAIERGPRQPRWMVVLAVVTAIAAVVAAFGTVWQACSR